jgi:hypothetical protein
MFSENNIKGGNMSNQKGTFLVSKSVKVETKDPIGIYDPKLQVNVVSLVDRTPLILSEAAPPTHSKTEARPGDDDPDPGYDLCY